METEKPLLDEATFTFTQEANCMSEHNVPEVLEIKCLADLGIDGSGGCFYVFKTEGWSINKLEELQSLLERIKKSIILENQEEFTWEDISEEYSKDQFPPFGGPFTDSINHWEWLKNNFETPNRKNSK